MDNKKALLRELNEVMRFPLNEQVITTKIPTATAGRLCHPDDFITSSRLQVFTPSRKIAFKAGDIVQVKGLGEGVLIGFSSMSNNPDVFFYEEQKIICVSIREIVKV